MTSDHRLHPASFLFGIGQRLRELALPLVVLLFSAGSAGLGWQVWLLVGMVPYTIVAIGRTLTFRYRYDDTTNAFKAYRREVVVGVQPLVSNHFNLTVEMPLKAIVRGYSYAVMPTSWRGRAAGRSKLDLREMGSRYLFIVLLVFLEHHLSRGDYRRGRPR